MLKKLPLARSKENNNSTVDDRERRLDLKCSLCPPNRKENQNRRPPHGKTKAKYKNHR